MIWTEKGMLASVNVQFNDLAFQHYKGGCIRSLTARNYDEFLLNELLLQVCFFSCLIFLFLNAGGEQRMSH